MASLYTNWTRSNNYNTPATDYDCRYYVDYTTSTNYYTRQSTITSNFGWIVSAGSVSVTMGTSAGVSIGGITYGPVTLENKSYVGGIDQKIQIGSYSRTFNHDAAGNCSAYIQGFGIDKGLQSLYEYTTNELIIFPNVGGLYVGITSYNVSNIGLGSVQINYTVDSPVDAMQYSIDGVNWIATPVGSPKTITGLTPNTYYGISIRLRRTDSQLWAETGRFYLTTFDYVKISNSYDFNDTQNATVLFNNPNGFLMNIRLEFDGQIIQRNNLTDLYQYTMVLTETERNLLRSRTPNSNTMTVRYVIATKLGSSEAYYSFQDKTLSIVNANPTFTNFTYEDTNATTIALTGSSQKIIKGYSNVKATVSVANKAVAQKYATMSKYRFVVGAKQIDANYSGSSDVTMTLNNIDNNVFTTYAIDSRSNSTLKQISPSTYIDYFNPYFSTPLPIATRTDGIGTGTTLTFSGQFFNATFGSATNNVTLTYKYKKTSDSTYTNGTTTLTVTKTGNQFSFTGLIAGDLGASGFDATYSYNIQIKATDSLTNVTYDLILGTGTPNLAIHSDGISINAPYNTTNGGDFQIGGINIFKLIYPVGCIYMSVSSTNPSSLFGGTWVAWGTGRVPVGIDTSQSEFNTIEETGGSKYTETHSHTQTVVKSNNVPLSATDFVSGFNGNNGGTATGATTNTFGTGNSGNLQPYITCYMWKRTV